MHTVVGALVALVGALVGLVAQETPRDGGADHQPKPRPILASVPASSRIAFALFVVGLAAGASAGIWARTHEWLGASPNELVKRWAGDGLSADEVRKKIFAAQLRMEDEHAAGRSVKLDVGSSAMLPGLFASRASACPELQGYKGRASAAAALSGPPWAMSRTVDACKGAADTQKCFDQLIDDLCLGQK